MAAVQEEGRGRTRSMKHDWGGGRREGTGTHASPSLLPPLLLVMLGASSFPSPYPLNTGNAGHIC